MLPPTGTKIGHVSIMVVGGAGYIGAHVAKLAKERGEKVVVIDDLSYGNPARVPGCVLEELDFADTANIGRMSTIMEEHSVHSVVLFAARKQVGESVEKPAWYYQQNLGGMANLLLAMETAGVREMIFSSSAAVYGMPPVEVVGEDIDKHPINPYGETKLIGEWLMADCERAWGLKWCGLRYFNVAGAGADDLGDPAILNLVPMVFERLDQGLPPRIFGIDYPTPDGTCIRDYIHVGDLAGAHLLALDYLRSKDEVAHHVFNVGNGRGYSVREVIDMIAQVTGRDFIPDEEPRRAGDPAQLIADPSRIREILGFSSSFGLREIVQSAWDAWQVAPGKR